MKLSVFGGTGGIGRELLKQALGKGHEVTALVRDPARLQEYSDRVTMLAGDVFDADCVARVVSGQDAVLCALGSRDLKKTRVRAEGTSNIIQAMKQNGVDRLIVVSAMGVGSSWKTLSLFNRFFFATLLRNTRADHEAQEASVTASRLKWTIVRPSGLVDTPGTGAYRVGKDVRAKTSKIPRADVAHLILNALSDEALIHKAVTITN